MATNVRVHPTFLCEVCGTSTRFHHLDAKLCSACASFYRRAVREGLQYRCESNQRCQTGKGRYACRACRFLKCQELGAQLPVTTNFDSSTAKSTLPAQPKQPVLDKLVAGYRQFHDAQRSLISLTYPEVQFNKHKLISNKKFEKVNLKEKCVPLLMDLFNSNVPPFAKLTKDKKKELLVDFSHEFESYNTFYLSSKYFPNMDDSRLMDSSNTYMDFNPKYTSYYYEGFMMPYRLEDYIRLMELPRDKMLSQTNKFRKVGIQRVDIIAFITLAMLKKIEQHELFTDEMSDYKEQMLFEWTTDACHKYGLTEGPQRLSRLLVLFYETDNLINDLTKHILLSQIQLDKTNTELMCGISRYMEKLDLGEDN